MVSGAGVYAAFPFVSSCAARVHHLYVTHAIVAGKLRMRVLMVENDAAVAKNLAAFFAGRKVRVESAETGEDALELLRHYEFDIVVLNLWLPDMDGSRVMTRIRAARLDVPVLALSHRAQPKLSVDAFAAGA